MTVLVEPTPAAAPKRMSIDEFMALQDSTGYELIDGVLTERKPMGALSDYIASQISFELNAFCRQRNAGYVFGSETTYLCFGRGETGRRADVSFIARGRLPGEEIPEGYIQIPADVVVEVVSPNDLAYNVEAKICQYLRHGFGELWVVYPNTRGVYVFRPGGLNLYLQDDQVLTGRGVLEGFACPVSRFFPPVAAPAPAAP
jgi:Uma2 family endonuclease